MSSSTGFPSYGAATATQAGLVSTTTQTIAGNKTLSGETNVSNIAKFCNGNEIHTMPLQDSNADVYWAYKGFNSGTAHFRSTYFCDGKGNVVGSYQGSTGAWTLGPRTDNALNHLVNGKYLSIQSGESNNSAYLRFCDGTVQMGAIGATTTNSFENWNAADNAKNAECTNAGAWTFGSSSGITGGHVIYGNTAAPGSYVTSWRHGPNSAASRNFFNITDLSNTTSYSAVSYNGTNTVWGTTSDRRSKENIRDSSESGLAVVSELKVKTFNMRGSDITQKFGFIAQEVYELVPNAVAVGDDGEDITAVTGTWSMDYGQLTPVLVKAIQELVVKLDAAEARIAALEGNK